MIQDSYLLQNKIIKKINFDNSIEIKINQKKLHITEQVAKHLLIKKH